MNQNNPTSDADWIKAINEIIQMLNENGYDGSAVIARWLAYIRVHVDTGQPFDVKESIRYAIDSEPHE